MLHNTQQKVSRCIPFVFLALMCLASMRVMASPSDIFPDLLADQRSLFVSEEKQTSYLLTLSDLKKINGEWLADREEVVDGRLQRRTIEISTYKKLNTLWAQVKTYFDAMNSHLVYVCDGLDCGNSNAWANTRFNIKQLYGLDAQQHYAVWQINNGGSEAIVVAYLVERGNRRIYLQLDKLTPSAPLKPMYAGAPVLAKQLFSQGMLEVPGLTISENGVEVDTVAMRALVKALNEQPYRAFTIEGHDYLAGTPEQQKTRSQAYAEKVMDVLDRLGVKKRRMSVVAMGALAVSQAGMEQLGTEKDATSTPPSQLTAGKVVIVLD